MDFAARQKYLFLDFICMTLLQRKKYTCRLVEVLLMTITGRKILSFHL